MKAYRYILLKSFASVLGVFLVITLIDLAFNFFLNLKILVPLIAIQTRFLLQPNLFVHASSYIYALLWFAASIY